MMATRSINASYDGDVDVLYVARGRPRPAYSDEGPDGIDYRFDEENNTPCGATVDGFHEYWANKEIEVASRIAKFLNVDVDAVFSAVLAAQENYKRKSARS